MKHLLLMLLAVLLMGCPVQNTPDPDPVPEPPVVATDMRTIVAPIERFSVPELVPFFIAFADVIERDDTIIKTTGDIREAYVRAGRLAFQKTGLQTETAGLGAKIDSALEQALGLQDRPLTADLRARAVAIFQALAWAVE